MKKFLLVMTFVFTCSPSLAAVDPAFNEANTSYQAREFKDAVKLYEELAAKNPTAAVYYNLGNSHFRLGHKGKARLYYERAHALAPRDPDIRWNLQVLKSLLSDNLEESGVWASLLEISGWLTFNEVSLLILAALLVLASAALLSFLFPRLRWLSGILSFLAIVTLLAASVFFFVKWRDQSEPRVVVLDKEVTVRYGPSAKETKAFVLHQGAGVRMSDRSREWVYVTLPDGKAGWVSEKSVEKI